MIPLDDAIETILSKIGRMEAEMVPITTAVGRVLAEDVLAPRNLPPRDNSAMDGYAFIHDSFNGESLKVIDEIAAGHPSGKKVAPGLTAKIMTGAPIPDGADTVVPVEDVTREGDMLTIVRVPGKGQNVRLSGEDVFAGDTVIEAGVRIRPAEIGMLAALGRSFVKVYQRPQVAILSTGDEIVEIDVAGRPGNEDKIVNSNSYGLAAQIIEAGGVPVMLGIARDDPEGLLEALRSAEPADILVTTGGVSMGDYDYVKQVIAEWGVKIEFIKVAVKPGRPVVFGMRGNMPVFGLPGNPVSAMVCFDQFVRPAVRKFCGDSKLFRPVVEAVLSEAAGVVKAKPGRTEFIRCKVVRDGPLFSVESIKKRGSGMLTTLVEANALLIMDPERGAANPGEKVLVQLYDYDFLEGREPGW